jgi:hypothetical protein
MNIYVKLNQQIKNDITYVSCLLLNNCKIKTNKNDITYVSCLLLNNYKIKTIKNNIYAYFAYI